MSGAVLWARCLVVGSGFLMSFLDSKRKEKEVALAGAEMRSYRTVTEALR